MAGHSKWANIKHKKAKEDAKRGKIFTKLGCKLTTEARNGGGDPSINASLRLLIDKARQANMPMDNITRAIKKGTGELEGAHYEEVMYEGYGPNGVALIIEALTDNKNRTVAEIRHIFTKHGGHMAEGGAVAWKFAHKGVVILHSGERSEDDLLELFLEHGVEDISLSDGMARIIGEVGDLNSLKTVAEQAGIEVESAELEWVPSSHTALPDQAAADKVHAFIDKLDDLDDVQQVFSDIE
ncbi:MAG: YebC/PmpR family DNA-binding transcriptional regulator [Candidatus Dependentiae bacterium]|jgi:YebC/PmpR family DNA-binding regulatory protein